MSRWTPPPSPIRPPSPNSRRRRIKLSGVLGHLLAITENYPDLKSNQNFLALQSQLEGTENRIEIARRDYNAAVQDYNTELVTIPGSLWAATHVQDRYKQAHAVRRHARRRRSAPVVSFPGATPPAPAAAAARPQPSSRQMTRSARGALSRSSVLRRARAGGADISGADRAGGGRRQYPVATRPRPISTSKLAALEAEDLAPAGGGDAAVAAGL